MQRKNAFLGLLLAVASFGASAQCTDYKWPQDQSKAEKYVDTFKAAIKEQNYKGATAGIQWMIANAPQWHSDLYVAAIDTYDKLSAQELDPATKQGYVDSLLIIYDLRIKNCGDEMNVLNRKAFSANKYNGQNKEKAKEVLAIFDKTYEVSGNNVFDNNLLAYMDVMRVNADAKALTEDQVVPRYNKLMEIIDSKIKRAEEQNKTAEVEKYRKVVAAVDVRLAKVAKINCAFVKKVFEPKFKANPNDAAMAKKIYQFMLTDKCTDDPVWLEAAEVLHANNPDFGILKELCSKYIQNKNFDKANPLLTEVQAKAAAPAEKSWIEILKGDIEFQKGNKPAARDLYRQSLVSDPVSKVAYERIGDLYSASASDCSKTAGSPEEKLVYIAAYQQYFKAANIEKCQQTLAKYPTAAELQKANWKAG